MNLSMEGSLAGRSLHGLATELSYSEMATDETGMIVTKERKMELRKQHGYCVTCSHGMWFCEGSLKQNLS